MLFGAVVVAVFFVVRTAMQVGAVGVAAFKAVVVPGRPYLAVWRV